MMQSETGSGKTLAYLLPLIEKIDYDKRENQFIVLVPTHELALQVNEVISKLADKSNLDIKSIVIMGDVNIKRQVEKLRDKPQFVIGSPGRILELIKLKKISAHAVKSIVIDECDKLLDQNNYNVVKDVIKTTMRDRQLMVFSATINTETLNIAKDLMKDPQFIKVEDKIKVNKNINHMYFVCERRDKIEVLRKLIASINPQRAIVFINKTEETKITTEKLQYHYIRAYGIYGKASKEERKKALDGFKRGDIQILVASDLAARGLDIKGVTHIINLDLPEDSKEYLHRVGRTGRAGKTGTAISIVTQREIPLIKKYQNQFNIKIEPKDIYKGKIINPRLVKQTSKNNIKKPK